MKCYWFFIIMFMKEIRMSVGYACWSDSNEKILSSQNVSLWRKFYWSEKRTWVSNSEITVHNFSHVIANICYTPYVLTAWKRCILIAYYIIWVPCNRMKNYDKIIRCVHWTNNRDVFPKKIIRNKKRSCVLPSTCFFCRVVHLWFTHTRIRLSWSNSCNQHLILILPSIFSLDATES